MSNYYMLPRALACTAFLGTLLLACSPRPGEVIERPGESDVHITRDDPRLAAARDTARQTLDSLLEFLGPGVPDREGYIKTPFDHPNGGTEHIWLRVLKVSPGVFLGRVDNEPLIGSPVTFGETLVVALKDVSDWMYRDSTGDHGAYTARVFHTDSASPSSN